MRFHPREGGKDRGGLHGDIKRRFSFKKCVFTKGKGAPRAAPSENITSQLSDVFDYHVQLLILALDTNSIIEGLGILERLDNTSMG